MLWKSSSFERTNADGLAKGDSVYPVGKIIVRNGIKAKALTAIKGAKHGKIPDCAYLQPLAAVFNIHIAPPT